MLRATVLRCNVLTTCSGACATCHVLCACHVLAALPCCGPRDAVARRTSTSHVVNVACRHVALAAPMHVALCQLVARCVVELSSISSISLTSACGSTGLARWRWKPAASARRDRRRRRMAVSAIAGRAAPRSAEPPRQRPHERVAVLAGHADVADQRRRARARRCWRQRLRATMPPTRTRPPARLERRRQQLARVVVVVHQHADAREPGAPARRRRRRRLGLRRRRSADATGRRTVNVAPRSCAVARGHRLPPCSSTSCLTIESPRPSPPCGARGGGVGLPEALEHVRQEPASMPMPVSLTTSSSTSPTRRAAIDTRPAARGVNLTAFDSRFQTTCCSRSGSPQLGMPPALEAPLAWRTPLASAAGRIELHRGRRTSATRSNGPVVEAQLAADDARDCRAGPRSAGPALRVALDLLERAIASWARSRRCARSSCVQPRMALSGVRSSCESVARNSSFRRLASRSRTSSSARSCSARGAARPLRAAGRRWPGTGRLSRASIRSSMRLNASTSSPSSSSVVRGRRGASSRRGETRRGRCWRAR